MEPDQTALALLVLFGTATLNVYGYVCYVGQEPVGATGKQYGWSLAEQRPCECTVFHLGGVDMKPQIKPFEVKIGEDNRVSVNEQGQIIKSSDCTEDQQETATFEITSGCHQVINVSTSMKLQLQMTSPLRLEFTVNTGSYIFVKFFTKDLQINQICTVYLTNDYAQISKAGSSSDTWKIIANNKGVDYIGVPAKITYDNGRFEVAVQGVQDSTLTYDVPSPPQPSWFVSFQTSTESEIIFTEPCINDFNPQFPPY